MHLHSMFQYAVIPVFLGSFLAGVVAQNCALRNSFHLDVSVSGAPPATLCVDTGWSTNAPLVSSGNRTGSNGQGCQSTAVCFALSNYGRLLLVAAGQANTCSAGGVHLDLDECAVGAPKAHSIDHFTVTSQVLAPGTPVQVRCGLTLAGGGTVTGTQPVSTWRADVLCNGVAVASVVDALGTVTALLSTTVGATVAVECQLDATVHELGVQAGPPNTGSFAISLQSAVDFACLTTNASLTFCSGAEYDPQSARWLAFASTCGIPSPILGTALPYLGTSCPITLSGAAPNAPLILGAASGPAQLTPVGPCAVWLPPAAIVLQTAGTTSSTGTWNSALSIPSSPALAGVLVTLQALPLVAGGPFLGFGQLSNALELRLGW
jgi:hypothetical protein